MEGLSHLESKILNLFNENPKEAENKLGAWIGPKATKGERAIIRNILSRIYIDTKGRYFLKDKLSSIQS